jgi:DNA (cytosine-5)-methyltransferase 1
LKRRKIKAADLFCGAGGTSTGLRLACEEAGIHLELIAVNHWDIAIATHSKNHPESQDICASLDTVNPRELIPDQKLDLLVASPECTHHSIARGGMPINDQSRASAWRILEWASQIEIKHILIENVPEFRTWGPLKKVKVTRDIPVEFPLIPFEKWIRKTRRCGGTEEEWKKIYGRLLKHSLAPCKWKEKVTITVLRPDERYKGAIYLQFLEALRAYGYTVEDRILNAADFGDPTSRERLFIQASLGRKRIKWPEPTHAPTAKKATSNNFLFDMTPTRKPYRTAREIIDWSIPGESIFTRKRPLRPNTLNRIFRGLEKFAGIPFIVPQEGDDRIRSIDRPLQVIKTQSRGIGLAQPYLVKFFGGQHSQSVDEPLPTITANYEHYGLAQPFIVELRNGQDARSLDKPLSTITTKGMHHGIAQPYLVVLRNNADAQSLDEPLRTLDCSNRFGFVEPFIIPTNHGQDERSHDINKPMPTVTSVDAWALIEPYLVKYNGTGGALPVDEPLETVTAKDRFGLVEPVPAEGQFALLDIRFRMLQPHELAAAMSFPKSYVFTGNREQKVKQIGNAVPCGIAKALCAATLEVEVA